MTNCSGTGKLLTAASLMIFLLFLALPDLGAGYAKGGVVSSQKLLI